MSSDLKEDTQKQVKVNRKSTQGKVGKMDEEIISMDEKVGNMEGELSEETEIW